MTALVREGKGAAATEGAGLFHDATEALTGFADGNRAEGLLNVASAAGGVGPCRPTRWPVCSARASAG
ncbi:hypothetical protein [Saccharothrix yanglingensis]|nr:hypothetical protein [Saccharothrix yanglingensis]